jgi:two-component system, OmpR family, KDP operon response regulator KdpE
VSAPTTILVVDDEPAILRALGTILGAHDYVVLVAASGEQAVARVADSRPDLVLLDLGLPGIDGIDVIRQVRTFDPEVPIVVLSAWNDDASKVTALDRGADDYVEKPFSAPELLARIRTALRHGTRSPGRLEATRITRGDITADLLTREVTRGGDPVQLTRTQFDLLICFLRHPGRVLTHRMLIAEVWGDPEAADAVNLRAFVSQLRRRLEPDASRPSYILTDPGVGYRFRPDPAAAG